MSFGGCGKGGFYILKKDDTLSSVAGRFGLGLAELLESNPYLDPNYYVKGQCIVIPFNMPVKEHKMLENESFSDILRRYDTNIKTVRRLNPMTDVFSLKSGCVINVPSGDNESDYIIGKNDTLRSIAEKNGMGIIELLKKNPNLRPTEFVEGQGIKL